MKPYLLKHLTPPRIFVLSFAGAILGGTVVLWLPLSSSGGRMLFIDALFTSTSAVCVTGLCVVDLGKDLTLLGQVATLFLFQIGGLGIITFSALLFEMTGRSISLKEREIVQSTFLIGGGRDFIALLKWVFLLTFIIESIGTGVLFVRFLADFPPGKAFYYALYHAVSAFNNCGYSLFSNSLISYQGDPIINLIVMILIVLGGIGFIVQRDVVARFRGQVRRLSVHTKIVLITTTILMISGAIFFYAFERTHILNGMSAWKIVLISLFQAITPRTCGFNTVDIGQLTNATILLIMMLMFIGASPGSTGGGIKTTSAALLFLIIWNRFKGREEVVNIFNRSIPREILTRTLSIILASAFSICLITSVLLLSGEGGLEPFQSRHLFLEYLFETISAFGTVGLSTGVTSSLNDIQKLSIILMMFAGRVGPLTLAFSLSYRKTRPVLLYAEEAVMVG